ncbi:MATE family efflux transporter [Borrelia anserina]|uniref:Multidrug-efflux transporter n=2 Tax=Borrelia anserina TaxID=143 RepID=W5SNS3_BORAN|nr:MATE family efflux transporter [Borrelia anserina]AHH08557.1 Na+ driven multidrug efflux pump [Borrelia anserina BA2]APR65024.1 MATE family efflux transporter [Borrelia anserina Es]UPA06949.1 MATE family efflux transporter [Borrelia anserina]
MLKRVNNYNSILGELFVLAVPTAFESFLFQLVTFFDNYMIAYLGSVQVTGVSLANRITFLFFIVMFGLGTTLSAYVSQAFSREKFVHVKQAFAYAFRIGTIVGMIFFCISFIFSRDIIKLFVGEDKSLNFGIEYLRIVSISYIFMSYSFLSAMGFKSIKDIRIPLVVTMFVVLINIVLNYIFIFLCSMGISGAAYATLLARIIEFVFYFFYNFLNINSYYHLKTGDFFVLKSIKIAYLKILIPVLLHEICWVLSITILHAFYARLGSSEYASFAVASNILDLCFVVMHGMAVATSVIIGHLMVNDKEHVRTLGVFLSVIGVILGFFVAFILLLISKFAPIIFVNLDSPELVDTFISIFASIVVFKGFTAQTLVGVFRASGIPNICFYIEVGIIVFYTLPVAYFLVFFTNFRLPLIVFIVNLEEILKNIFILIEFFKDNWIKEIHYEELT